MFISQLLDNLSRGLNESNTEMKELGAEVILSIIGLEACKVSNIGQKQKKILVEIMQVFLNLVIFLKSYFEQYVKMDTLPFFLKRFPSFISFFDEEYNSSFIKYFF